MTASRYGVLCLVLFLAVLGLGYKNFETWSQPAGAVIKREVPKKPEARREPSPESALPSETVPLESYKAISEKNIFHPDRQEFQVTAAAEQPKPSARPQIALYGVVLAGNYQSATIVNPGRPLMKGEREAKSVKPGDRIGEYKVAKILEDRIVMESAGDSFEVLLYDPNAPKKRIEVKTPVQPAAVTSSLAGPAPAPGAPPVPPRTPPGSPSPAGQPVPPIPQPAPQAAAPRPAEPAPGTALQPQTTPSPAAPGVGIWRGRRPFRPADPATPQQGN